MLFDPVWSSATRPGNILTVWEIEVLTTAIVEFGWRDLLRAPRIEFRVHGSAISGKQ